ncbi:MAG: hypothetical protein KJ645_06010, partial [Planctomycetes bacterium]|nr:hypothetical protein [Planctomycetota bacterium]
MRITRGREEDKSLAKHPWKVLGGISGLGLILMLAAFPLPAFMQNRSIEEEIDGFLLQQKRLPALTEEVARLKVSVP